MGRTGWVGKTGMICGISGVAHIEVTEGNRSGTYSRSSLQYSKAYYIKKFIKIWNLK